MTLASLPQYDSTGSHVAAIVESLGLERPLAHVEEGWTQTVLRSLRAGSAGVVVLVAGYGPYLPHVGTSPSVVDRRSLTRASQVIPVAAQASFSDALSMSVADQLREVLAALSLNKSQLAEVLGVSRPTLYDWFEGKVPNPSNAERVTTILRLITNAGVTGAAPLNARFVRHPVNAGGASLLEALRADVLDETIVSSLLHEARSLGARAEARRANREDRLRELGFEEPSAEQRREQLARNIALAEWPKP